MTSDETIAAQIDEIYRHRVLRARSCDPMEKMWDGPRLFEMACRMMLAGAAQQKGVTNAAAEVARRLELSRILYKRKFE